MKQFKIYGFINKNPILITNSNNISSNATFEESLTLQEHMRYTLSFKISDILPSGEKNQMMSLIYPGAKIRLELIELDTISDFIVKEVKTEINQLNIIYNISLEDYASTIYSKEGQGLTLSHTGTLRELIYEVLVQSRKNLGYQNLSKNYLVFNSFIDKDGAALAKDEAFSKIVTDLTSTYITFPRSRDLILYNYNLFINLLSTPTSGVHIRIVELDNNNTVITSHYYTTDNVENIYSSGIVILNFTPRNSMAYYRIELIPLSTGTISITDWKIKLDEAQFSTIISQSLSLNPLFNEEDFKGQLGDTSYYKKITLDLKNSNLYNGLIELAKVFNADLRFDYVNNYINFMDKDKYTFKGLRLSPTFNLTSLSREETYNEFASALNITGNENVYSIYPEIPSEFKAFFNDQIDNNFSEFNDYNSTTYADIVPLVKTYISNTNDYDSHSKLIEDFAIAADKVPNFENRLYSLDYFKKTGKISDTNLINFNNIVNNDLRKVNIKLRMFSDQYSNANSSLSLKETEIEFLSKNITVELLAQKLLLDRIAAEEVNSSRWITYINDYNASIEQIDQYKIELMQAYNIVFDILTLEPLYLENIVVDGRYRLADNSYTSLMLNVYGYYNIYKNGIRQKLDDIILMIKELANDRATWQAEVDNATLLLADPTISSFRKQELEVSKSGYEAQIEASKYLIGEYATDVFTPSLLGQYHHQKYYLETINSFLGNYVYKDTKIDYSTLVVGQDLNITNYWSSTGNATVVLEGNKDYPTNGQQDIMIKIQNYQEVGVSAAIATTKTDLLVGKKYIARGILKIPANVEGIFKIESYDIPDNPYMTVDIRPMIVDRWLVYNYYITGENNTKVYSFPEYSEIPSSYIVSTYSNIITSGPYHIKYSFVGTGSQSIYIYRPRLDEYSISIPTVEDLYDLYDNPLMVNYEEDFHIDFNTIEGLYDLLYNYNYSKNVTKAKNIIINNLYKSYEPYLIENYYDNSDELNSEGLMEQALLAFEKIKYPRIQYGISMIDLSDLENYRYLTVNVGDKILIGEAEDRLYKSYQPESTKYLQIFQIQFNLRQPESTSLTVQQDDETTKILQYILKATY